MTTDALARKVAPSRHQLEPHKLALPIHQFAPETGHSLLRIYQRITRGNAARQAMVGMNAGIPSYIGEVPVGLSDQLFIQVRQILQRQGTITPNAREHRGGYAERFYDVRKGERGEVCGGVQMCSMLNEGQGTYELGG